MRDTESTEGMETKLRRSETLQNGVQHPKDVPLNNRPAPVRTEDESMPLSDMPLNYLSQLRC
jgi:hypothetical protein